MKRRIKTERIIILLLSSIVILQSVFLIILLCTSKKSSTCTNGNKLTNASEVVCGDDSDIARFMCVRFHEPGYIITYKDNVDDNAKHNVISRLMNNLGGAPAMYVDKMEINNSLRNTYGLQTEKDFGIDSFIFVPNYNNLDEERLKQAVKNNKELDKIITFKVSN